MAAARFKPLQSAPVNRPVRSQTSFYESPFPGPNSTLWTYFGSGFATVLMRQGEIIERTLVSGSIEPELNSAKMNHDGSGQRTRALHFRVQLQEFRMCGPGSEGYGCVVGTEEDANGGRSPQNSCAEERRCPIIRGGQSGPGLG
ncbi:hypothetical protein B0H13DRAFT_1850163 [Mycena leptocephala]|nr:hypothetical protein B0H13DRAFT_1850163 [Mycena leptocephala]